VAGRSIGIVQCLEGSLHPLLFHPAYAEVASLPLAERVVALREPERWYRLTRTVPDDGGFFAKVVLERTSGMFVVDGDIDYEPDATRSVADVAARRGITAMTVIAEELCADAGTGMLYTPFFNYAYGDLSMTHDVLAHPHTRNGLSDAGAHCGAICDGGTPTFMLTHWVRDRSRGPRLALEHVVHRQTRQSALLYGLADRGLVAPGYKADLNVIDLDALRFDRPRMAYDLPAGGRRLVQRGSGYAATVCSGTLTVADDEFTGDLPGLLVRGPQGGVR
jgi:N-acyl-D-amino-acid deacylase